MAPQELPEDLTKLDDTALNDLQSQIKERAESLAEAEELSDSDIDEINALADAGDAIAAEITARSEKVAARASQRDAALARIRGENDDLVAEDGDGEDAAAAEVVAEAEAIAAEAPVPAAASTGSPQSLASRRPAANSPKTSAGDEPEFMRATVNATGYREGHVFGDTFAVAKAISEKRARMGSIPTGTHDEKVSVAMGTKPLTHTISNDEQQNFAVLREVRNEAQSLVASGAWCAPLSPLYDFYRLAEPQSPVEDSLAVVQAPRGGIRYITSPGTAAALAAAELALDISASDRDYSEGEDGTKNCTTVTCPPVVEREVEAISQCIQFDNLNYRVFPEQVEAFLEDVAVAFASRKERYYLDYIDAQSTPVTSDYDYGASRSLLRDWTLTAVGYRKRNGMKRDSVLDVLAPDWAMDVIRLDIAMDSYSGHNMWDVTDEQVVSILRSRGLNVVWYNDYASGHSDQKMAGAQAAGLLNQWPTNVVAYFFAPGTFVRLDGGSLDVGLVRDSILNGTNDLQLFMEEWIGIAKLGIESIRLVSTITVNGAGPCCVTAATT